MKKLSKILSLTLVAMMLMSVSAFALIYKADPAVETFSGFNYSLVNCYNYLRESSSASTQNYNHANRAKGWSSSTCTSNGTNNKLKAGIIVGMAGKSMSDKALYLTPSANTYAAAAIQMIVNVGSADKKTSASNYEEAYGPTVSQTTRNTATVEFDYFTLGNHDNVSISYYQLKETSEEDPTLIYDNDGMQGTIISNGKIHSGFKKDGVATNTFFSFEKGKWYHITTVKKKVDSGTSSWDLYINGEFVGQSTTGGHREVYKAKLDISPGNVSSSTDKELTNYQMAVDNLRFSYGDDSANYLVPSVLTQENGAMIVDAVENTIEVPYGTTVAELKQGLVLNNTTAEHLKVYENYAQMTGLVYSTQVTGETPVADSYFADSAVLSNDNILTVENSDGNGYAYYEIKIAEGLKAQQGDANKKTTFSSLTDDVVLTFSENPEAAGTRMIIAGVYDASGKLVDVFMSGEEATSFEAGEQQSITATVESNALTGLTAGATIKAFVWNDLEKLQPVEVDNQSMILTYTPGN